MWRDLKLFIWGVFHASVFLFACVLLIAPFVQVHAQNHLEVEDLSRRITTLEGLNLDHRLTVIETLLNNLNDSKWPNGITTGGVGLLIFERVFFAVKKKVKETES